MSIHEYDVIVLGAGPAGEVAAGHLAERNLRVAIIEHHLVAGECSFYACMPSKALLRPGSLLAEARRVPGTSEAVTGDLDPAAVLKRRDDIIHRLDDSNQLPFLEKRGIDLFRGHGVISGEREVRVGDDVLVAERAVMVATGTAASVPVIDGIDQVEIWNNRQGTTAHEVPESLLVLGGGPVGAELAQAWSSLGSQVTLVEGASRLLSKEEPFAAEAVLDGLREQHGVEVLTDAAVERISGENRGRPDSTVTLHLKDGSQRTGAELLVATGRVPRSDMIGLESIGLESDDWLSTDDRMRVDGIEWLYAVGDVNGRSLLTHAGKYQAWIATRDILGEKVEPLAEAIGYPRVTFTDPQVAAVGLTLEQAEKEGFEAVPIDVASDGTAGASFHGKDTGGTSRLVVERESGRILGATFVGFETAEWIHAATIAVTGRITMDQLRHAVPVFPTRSEIWLRLQEKWAERVS